MTTSVLNGLSSTVSVRLDPPRPAPTGPFNVADTAREIVQLSRGSPNVASRLIDAYTARQPAALRDAVERSVAAQLRDNGTLDSRTVRGTVSEGAALWRFDNVLRAAPIIPVTTGLSDGQKFDVYASIVQAFGDQPALDDLANAARNGQPTMIALRNETSTLANRGRGEYDDRVVVISRDRDGTPRVLELWGNTEPSAQYDYRAGDRNTGRAAESGYEQVVAKYDRHGHRKIDGALFNDDQIPDMGRLSPGTYHYVEKDGGFLGARAFLVNGNQRAQRDVNGDGNFTNADVNRRGRTTDIGDFRMYIHRGGPNNTWSAGCQTIPQADYPAFLRAMGPNPIFSYVLLNAR